jgi:plasmid maintenance system antidote protein VapI
MKQEDIAKKTGLDPSHISLILNGKRGISKGVALKFSENFGKDPGFWMFLTPEEIRNEIEAAG